MPYEFPVKFFIMGMSVFILFLIALRIFNEPVNNEKFLNKCQSVGFTVDQCHFFRYGAGDDNDDGGAK